MISVEFHLADLCACDAIQALLSLINETANPNIILEICSVVLVVKVKSK